MPYIVLALGVLMFLAGGYEASFGYSIIEVERGWSAFIAGTVLLTGGLLTIALGLAIRALADLKTVLVERVDGLVHKRSVGAPPASNIGHDLAFPSASSTPDRVGPDRVGMEAGDLRFDPLVPGHTEHTLDRTAVGLLRNAGEQDMADAHEAALDHEPEHDFAHVDSAAEPFGEEHATETLHHDAAAPIEAMVHPAEEPEHATELTPAMDDWLDRSFADLGRETVAPRGAVDTADGPFAPTPEPHADLAEIERPRFNQPKADRFSWRTRAKANPQDPPASLEPAAAEPIDTPTAAKAEPTSAPSSPEPAVIGRYEAEGTSYIMFADGSIEAQSDAGVYRFGSMAELKTFIEG